MRRREFLEWTGSVTRSLAGSLAVSAIASTWLARSARADDSLLVHTTRPQNLATPIEYFDRLITPTPMFFTRSHFGPPALDLKRRLRVEGGSQTLDLGIGDLMRKFEKVTHSAVLQCAGNGRALHEPHVPGIQWGHGAMGQARWTGARLADVLEAAGFKNATPSAAHVRLEGWDVPPGPKVPAFIRGIPMERALDPSTIIAYEMNDLPLTLSHGAPMRLVVPGWSGNHWIKWLKAIRVQSEEAEGFYSRTGYRQPRTPIAPGAAVKPEDTIPVTSFPVKSIIARPTEGSHQRVGVQEIVGVAFSGEGAIQRVEVSADGGNSWHVAALEGEPKLGSWQVFRWQHEVSVPARVRVMARAVDTKDNVQPKIPSWNPSGYHWNACHSVTFEVRA